MAGLSASEYAEYLRRIDNASTKAELEAIKSEILEKADESDPKIKALIKRR